MRSTITEIIEKIDRLREDLGKEYVTLAKKYGFSIEGKRVVFLEAIREYNKSVRLGIFRYIFSADIRHILSIPFIYGMIIPVAFLDLFLFVYQVCAFPLYKIPRVKRSEYIVYDRQFLDYLNIIQKVNCLYCSYANGVFAYAVEVGARTERYWCPIKAARHPKLPHVHYSEFADYGDPEGFKELFNDEQCFNKNMKND